MQDEILELYPEPGTRHSLQGLYLDQPFPDSSTAQPFIYSNFISSLDGRIAVPGPDRNSHQVPPAIGNSRDWRLFQELAAHADLLITSARYFRQAADQETQAELPIGMSEEFADLRQWRLGQGYPAQPDLAIFSASLDLPHAPVRAYEDRNVLLLTGEQADETRLREITEHTHARVISCGANGHVDGSLLRAALAELGYRRVYAIAGPAVLHTLASGNALDRLYHTTAHCLLGGKQFDTFVWGEPLEPALCLPLRACYYDRHAPPGAGQTLSVYGR